LIVTYLRSSSANTFDWCNRQYFISYVLNVPSKANFKATMGNVVHKGLELLALGKLAQQKGEEVVDGEDVGKMSVAQAMNPDNAYELGYKLYSEMEPEHPWSTKIYTECRDWMQSVLEYHGGAFDPRNRKVIAAEYRFDIPLQYEWAAYEYDLPNGQKLRGCFSIKGTVDLISELSPGVIEILDWKTGQYKTAFHSMKEKDFEYILNDDTQLRMYHYAVSMGMPHIEHMISTIFYVRVDGPTSIHLGREHIPQEVEMLKKYFLGIQKAQPTPYVDWRCRKFCSYGGRKSGPGLCDKITEELKTKTVQDIMLQYGDISKLTSYQDGGGRKAKDE
jgi:ATP-dependent helicase/DNAse subunit B